KALEPLLDTSVLNAAILVCAGFANPLPDLLGDKEISSHLDVATALLVIGETDTMADPLAHDEDRNPDMELGHEALLKRGAMLVAQQVADEFLISLSHLG